MGLFSRMKVEMPAPEDALPGRAQEMPVTAPHFVLGTPITPPFPEGTELALFGMGCFWGAERMFWQLGDGIHTTAVGYSAGYTPNPTYEEVCSARTGHNEVVRVVFDPEVISYEQLLATFWEGHDPTQGMRQGNDVGTQYRSGDLHILGRAAAGRRGDPRRVPGAADRRGLRRHHHRDRAGRGTSTTRRTTTSSTSRRCRTATAASAAPASPAPWGS